MGAEGPQGLWELPGAPTGSYLWMPPGRGTPEHWTWGTVERKLYQKVSQNNKALGIFEACGTCLGYLGIHQAVVGLL